MAERRAAPRFPLAVDCVLRRGKGSPIAARTVEVGPGGMSVTCERPLATDEVAPLRPPAARRRGGRRRAGAARAGLPRVRAALRGAAGAGPGAAARARRLSPPAASDRLSAGNQGGSRMRAEIAPRAALTLRTCGVMPAEGAMHSGAGLWRWTRRPASCSTPSTSRSAPVRRSRRHARRRARASSSPSSGPSGCGKSTLLELVCGLAAPDAGRVDAPPAALMPQRDALLPWPSALDNAALALRVGGVPRARGARPRARALRRVRARGLRAARGRPRSRAACASASRSCARCWRAARCSASTSRSARSTRSPGSPCSAGSPRRSRASRARSCSSPTTSRRRCCSPTASCCSPRGRARSPRCSRSTLPRPRARDDAAVVALRERALEVLGRAVMRRAARPRRCSAAGSSSSALGGVDPLILPAPTQVAEALWEDRALLAPDLWTTTYEVAARARARASRRASRSRSPCTSSPALRRALRPLVDRLAGGAGRR